MAINARSVIRVIIDGEWLWVQRGTFTVVPLQFVDDENKELHEATESAYFFVSTNGDPYFGPLSGISLMKLDTQMLEETSDEYRQGIDRSLGLPSATTEPEEAKKEAPVKEGGVQPPVPLFTEDAEGARKTEPADEEPRRRGLF